MEPAGFSPGSGGSHWARRRQWGRAGARDQLGLPGTPASFPRPVGGQCHEPGQAQNLQDFRLRIESRDWGRVQTGVTTPQCPVWMPGTRLGLFLQKERSWAQFKLRPGSARFFPRNHTVHFTTLGDPGSFFLHSLLSFLSLPLNCCIYFPLPSIFHSAK